MKISDIDRKVFSFVQTNASLSAGDIAKKMGMKESSVRHSMSKLLDMGSLIPRVFIDTCKLGYSQYMLLVSLRDMSEEQRYNFILKATEDPCVTVVLQLGGKFHFEIDLAIRVPEELAQFYSWFSEFGRCLDSKIILKVWAQGNFGTSGLGSERRNVEEHLYRVTNDRIEIDEVDHQLLRHLTSCKSFGVMGAVRATGMPKATVSYRLKNLEKTGIIAGYMYDSRSETIGLRPFVLLMQAVSNNEGFREGLHKFAREHCYIDYYKQMIGSFDFILGLSVPESSIAADVAMELKREFPDNVLSTEVLTLFKVRKVSDYPFEKFVGPS